MYIYRSESVINHLFTQVYVCFLTQVYVCFLVQVCLCFSTSDFVRK